eukprot:TRINITY_DN840_c0_g1_i2.p1 TRINITY_DN840_c0_g1~~TRINITY_DN840_c0_g1_i2.p1  ORF type:complete len:131 (+),score=5.20 TRINITY_DN840_c0_g1_i2:154-546(+)
MLVGSVVQSSCDLHAQGSISGQLRDETTLCHLGILFLKIWPIYWFVGTVNPDHVCASRFRVSLSGERIHSLRIFIYSREMNPTFLPHIGKKDPLHLGKPAPIMEGDNQNNFSVYCIFLSLHKCTLVKLAD